MSPFVYALDAETSAINGSIARRAPWKGSDVGCADPPLLGITGTPVIDPGTATAYHPRSAQRVRLSFESGQRRL